MWDKGEKAASVALSTADISRWLRGAARKFTGNRLQTKTWVWQENPLPCLMKAPVLGFEWEVFKGLFSSPPILPSLRRGVVVSHKPPVYYGGEEGVSAISDPLLSLQFAC